MSKNFLVFTILGHIRKFFTLINCKSKHLKIGAFNRVHKK